MDYRKITHTNSKQYELQQECWTDELGLRRHGSDYVIALGTYFSDTVGDRFKVHLDNGNSFYATIGDIKADSTTDEMNSLLQDETNSNNQFIKMSSDIGFKQRQLACQQMNEMFGLNVSVVETQDEFQKEVMDDGELYTGNSSDDR